MKSNEKLLEEWLQRAEDDLVVAKRAVKGKMKITWIGCFHAQQSAEKYLKAFLISRQKEPPKTHDLIELLRGCTGIEPELTLLGEYCEFLNPFAVQIRYPTGVDPQLSEARKAIRAAEAIKKEVFQHI
jgi:HEPN domain-containing protein